MTLTELGAPRCVPSKKMVTMVRDLKLLISRRKRETVKFLESRKPETL